MNSIIQEVFQNQSLGASSIPLVLFTIVMAFVVGVFIYWVYKKTYRGVMFSNNFALTLILMTVITAPVVVCIRNNVALSMGMVGALSIVRFRTAVKDPLDTGYMFWALTMGILLGAGQFFLAILVVVIISALIFVLTRLSFKGADSFLLVVRGEAGAEQQLSGLLAKGKLSRLKSKTVTARGYEITFEVRVDKPDAFLNRVLQVNGVQDATLVAYQNETT